MALSKVLSSNASEPTVRQGGPCLAAASEACPAAQLGR